MKTALVTGANKGIGYEISRHLGKEGWQVVIGARNGTCALKAMDTLKADSVNVAGWMHVDLSSNEEITQDAAALRHTSRCHLHRPQRPL